MAGHLPASSAAAAGPTLADRRPHQVRAAQVRLLYDNASIGVAVTAVAAPVLGYFQWGGVHPALVIGWVLSALAIAAARFALVRRYQRSPTRDTGAARWGHAFAAGAGIAGLSWGAAGIVLYPGALLMNQVVLVFVLGGMMLGGSSLLAPRSDASLAFLLPTGLLPALRLVSDGGQEHVVMGLLAVLFTAATAITSRRISRTIESSLNLRFDNQSLLEHLQDANRHTAALNEQLEIRVQERTAELRETAERLRAEITNREGMEEELLRARKLESLGVLAGGIAHDFNNFLTVIQGNLELARMQLPPGAAVGPVLEQTANACQRALFLSSQLLTFAKGGAPVRRVTSIARIIADAVDLARAGAAVRMVVDVADDLWEAEVDAGQIGQVLHNILLNAKQAMADGGTIDICARNVAADDAAAAGRGNHVTISITDQGPGIPAEILPQIFDPYFTTKQTGSGLGLATAYAIVSKHDGRLSAQSQPGRATVFTIAIPAVPSRSTPAAPAGRHPQSGTGNVLVMDDEEPIRKLLIQVLSRLGYAVSDASDGAQAIDLHVAAKASGCAFDAVLLDLTVSGGMGGAETAIRLRALDPAARLIASSGYSDAPVMANFRDYGFDDVLSKPYTLTQLSELLKRVLAAPPDQAVDGSGEP